MSRAPVHGVFRVRCSKNRFGSDRVLGVQLAPVGQSRAGGVLLVAQVLAVDKFPTWWLHGASLQVQDCS